MAYRIATSGADYRKCHQFAAMYDPDSMTPQLSFPTLMYEDDGGKVEGFLSTYIWRNKIIAGPLIVRKEPRNPVLVYRLFEMYDAAMKGLGITDYYFTVPSENTSFLRAVEKIGFSPMGQGPDGLFWFKRSSLDGR